MVAGAKCDHKDNSSVTLVSQGGLPTWTVQCMALVEGTAGAQGLGLIFLVQGSGCGGSWRVLEAHPCWGTLFGKKGGVAPQL